MNIQKCKVDNVEYFYDKKNGFDMLIDNQRINYPDSIYKYCSISKNSISAFREHYLYASHPKDFNDPFDCNERLIIPPKSPKELYIYNEISKELRLNKNHDYISIFYNLLFYHFGIVSMTTNDSNMYMWTHYTNNHSGFLLKFTTKKLIKNYSGIYKVNYIKSISPVVFDDDNLVAQIFMMICSKSDKWIAEDEWRLLTYGSKMFVPGVHNKEENENLINNRKIEYNLDSLEEIILGHYFFSRNNIVKIDQRKYYLNFDNDIDDLKIELLDFIINNRIQTKWIFLNLSDFELEPMKIEISKKDKLFIFDIIDN